MSRVLRLTFFQTQVDTSKDGLDLPVGAHVDAVEHVSMGEWVNVDYHLEQEVEVPDDIDPAIEAQA